ncbi:radical SAM protein [Proteiniclasticum sp. SCR006]|uniref:Radical SAM protein n=2 Tax=Proteiniclasticum aestuarii TaxID=2817862 RepID=A0A939KLT5_9CLOT|nr:radical SAM protein [Proteiniclasticum aestuarii]
MLCPRNCGVNRNQGEIGFCGVTSELLVARAALHMWEEPCLSGEKGSGTVFFSGCAMGCVFCQNHEIALGRKGKIISVSRLAEIFLELQEKGANNINLVTPSHYVPQIIKAIRQAKKRGLVLPIVYNSSGYEKVETLKLLDGLIDIYLPDFKYMDGEIAHRYSRCRDYAQFAKPAIEEMVRQTGEPLFNEEGIMIRGTIVRHLSLPGFLHDSKDILTDLQDTFKDRIFISIMNQYTPMISLKKYPELTRKVTKEEYDELVMFAKLIRIHHAFIQEEETQDESFIPSFDGEGV